MTDEKKRTSTEMTKPPKTSGSIQRYEDYDESDTAQQRDDFDKQTGPSIWMKIEDGEKVRFRILPPPVGEDGKKKPRWRSLRVHHVPMPGAKFDFRVVCPAQWTDVYGDAKPRGKCPVCAEVMRIKANAMKLEDEGKLGKAESENDRAYELSAKRRCFASVLIRGLESEGPKLWEFGGGGKKSMEARILKILESDDEDEGGPNMTSIAKGYDLKIERSGRSKTDTTYTLVACRPSPLSEDPKQAQEWLEAQIHVDRLKQFKVLSAEEIVKVLNGEKPDGEDDDDRSKKGRRDDAPRSKTSSAPDAGETIDADIEIDV